MYWTTLLMAVLGAALVARGDIGRRQLAEHTRQPPHLTDTQEATDRKLRTMSLAATGFGLAAAALSMMFNTSENAFASTLGGIVLAFGLITLARTNPHPPAEPAHGERRELPARGK